MFNRNELITIKVALMRAMNSLDNEIAEYMKIGDNHAMHSARIRIESRAAMIEIYNEMDTAINEAAK